MVKQTTCILSSFKGYVLFVGQKNTLSTDLHLHSLKIMIAESFPENLTCWGAVVLGKWVKQCHEDNNNRLSGYETKNILACKTVFSWHRFTYFSKTTAPQQL